MKIGDRVKVVRCSDSGRMDDEVFWIRMKPNRWYTNARAEIVKMFGDDADLFCDILAATSPRKQVKANWRLAEGIYSLYKEVGASMCMHMIYTGKSGLSGIMPNHKNNIHAALFSEPLSGRKVRSFAANLKGDLDVVTVDVWMMRYFGYETITDKIYNRIEGMVTYVSKVMGCKPAEVQAELWCEALRMAGKTPKSFLAAIDKQMYLWR